MPRGDRTASKRSKPSESEYAFMRFVKTGITPTTAPAAGGHLGVGSSDHRAEQGSSPRVTLKRAALAAATAFIAVNIWTGCPLLALWVGSQVEAGRPLSMAAVGAVVGVLGVLELVMLVALTWLSNIYDRLTGRPRAERRATWLRSMRAEAEGHVSQKVGITRLERIVMINVYVAVIALLAWFFIFAGSPLLR